MKPIEEGNTKTTLIKNLVSGIKILTHKGYTFELYYLNTYPVIYKFIIFTPNGNVVVVIREMDNKLLYKKALTNVEYLIEANE